jgi:WD40 repeat protein
VLGPDEGVLRITPDLHLERRNADGTPRETLGEALEAPVTALACDVASRRAVTTDLGGTLTLWDAETCAQLHRRDVGDAVPTAVALFPGGEKVAYGTLAGDLATWSTNTPRPVTMQGTRGSTVTALAIDANAEVVVAGFADGAVEVWSLERREKIDSIEGVGPSPTCVAAGAGGATVAWYTTDDRLFVWEAAEGRIVALGRPARGASALAVELRDDGSVHALLLDGRRIAVAPDGSITSDGETTLAVALSGAGPSWILRSPIAQLIELETRYGMMVEGLRVRLADAERIQANQPRIAPWSDLR